MREVKSTNLKKRLLRVYKCGYHERYNYRRFKGLGRQLLKSLQQSGNNLFVCSRSEVQLYNMMDEMMLQYPQCHIKARPADLSQKIRRLNLAIGVCNMVYPVY